MDWLSWLVIVAVFAVLFAYLDRTISGGSGWPRRGGARR